jgi:hypothetical protein
MTINSWFKLPSFFNKKQKKSTTLQQNEEMSNEKVIPTTFTKILNDTAVATAAAAVTTGPTAITPHPLEMNHVEKATANNNNNSSDGSINNKDIVPLRQFLRYSMNRSDQRNFQRRRITRPFEPKYEIEWQKNQWLQLDSSTSRQIEHLRKNGFSKIAIRKDTCLKKHIDYDNPSEVDVLLELSFNNNISPKLVEHLEPIVCHQPSQFAVRRTHWWRTSDQVAEAYLPDWVDSDLCCDAVVMDAPSVLAAMTDNYSRSSISSFVHQHQHPKLPDTPIVSQKSSFLHLHHHLLQQQQQHQEEDPCWSYKPLQYNNPPFLMDKPALVIG